MAKQNRWIASGLSITLVMCVAARRGAAEVWPQFRGPNIDGVPQSECPTTWDNSTNVRWRIPMEGEGWSCPVVWDEQVFVTAAVRTDAGAGRADANAQREAPRPRRSQRRGRGRRRRSDLTKATYRWDVICLDARSGETIWQQTARTGHPPIPRHSSNSYATETAVTDGERVYAYFGMTGLYCYDMSGKPLWTKDLGTFEMRAGWGTSSSPILFDGKLFLQIDNEERSFLVALNAETGDEVWRMNRDEPSQYSTPIVWKNSQRAEVIAGGQHCRSYDPQTGRLLWSLDMEKGRSSATPLAVGDRLYVGTELRNRGGPDDGGGFLFAIRPSGAGDITPSNDGDSSEYVDWKIAQSGIQVASPVYCAGYLYLLERRGGSLRCVNADTGETAYRTRIPEARAFWASPWTHDGKVFCLDDSGTTTVVAGGPEFQVLRQNGIDEQTWSSPAIADGALFLRSLDHLYCIAESPQ